MPFGTNPYRNKDRSSKQSASWTEPSLPNVPVNQVNREISKQPQAAQEPQTMQPPKGQATPGSNLPTGQQLQRGQQSQPLPPGSIIIPSQYGSTPGSIQQPIQYGSTPGSIQQPIQYGSTPGSIPQPGQPVPLPPTQGYIPYQRKQSSTRSSSSQNTFQGYEGRGMNWDPQREQGQGQGQQPPGESHVDSPVYQDLQKLAASYGRNQRYQIVPIDNLEYVCVEVICWICCIIFLPLAWCAMCFVDLKIAMEYERVVIFRLGRLLSSTARGPGIIVYIPLLDEIFPVDLRTVSIDLLNHQTITADALQVAVDAVMYYHVEDPTKAIVNVADYRWATTNVAIASLRNNLGRFSLREILKKRSQIAREMKEDLQAVTEQWGIVVELIEIKDIRIPPDLIVEIATEAATQRQAKAQVLRAEGEQLAAGKLLNAAHNLSSSVSVHLRSLQELANICAGGDATIWIPVPMFNMVECFPSEYSFVMPRFEWAPPPMKNAIDGF